MEKHINFRLDLEIAHRLKVICAEEDINVADVYRVFAEKFIQAYNNSKNEMISIRDIIEEARRRKRK